jgi:tetratricopeptide (TPR) repeat protein
MLVERNSLVATFPAMGRCSRPQGAIPGSNTELGIPISKPWGEMRSYDFIVGRPRRFDKSTEHFQGSIEKDPGFALAYAGLADSYIANAIRSSQNFYPKAKAAASRALELDDDLAEAHAALGAEKATLNTTGKERSRNLSERLNSTRTMPRRTSGMRGHT